MDFDYSTETITPDQSTILTIGGTGAIEVPVGTTANRPVAGISNGALRYNSDIIDIEGYINNTWVPISTSTTSVTTFSGGTTGLTPASATSGAVTLAGTLAIANGGTGLTATPTNGQLDIGNGTGFTRTTLTAGTAVSVTNASGSITIANTGVTSNVAGSGISISSGTGAVTITNTGVTSFTAGTTGFTPSTSTTGVVTLAGTLVPASGGTGVTTTPTNGQLLVGNGTNYTVATLASGTGISTTTGAGTLQINNTGVTSLAGTASNITASGSTGVVTLDLATVTQGSGSSFVKVTLDTKGRVTGNTAIVQSDLTSLLSTYYLPSAGGTMSGAINLGANQINNLGMAVTPLGTDAVNVNYVQAQLTGLSWKQAVKAATTGILTSTYANGVAGVGSTLTSTTNVVLPTIDTVSLSVGDRVLVKNQGTALQNGIYSVTSLGSAGASPWVLTRTTDSDTTLEVNGSAVYVDQGSTNLNTGWTETSVVSTIGTDSITYAQFSGSGTYAAGTGISLTGNTFANTGVLSISGGTTGLTPSTATAGVVTLAGTLAIANGGTGLTATPTNGQLDIGNGTGFTRTTLTAGTGISIANTSGAITLANTGVTSVGLALPSFITVTGSPVTTTGTLTGTLASQTANTVFIAPNGSAGAPTFRALAYADLPLKLYVENPSTPIAPLAAGTNAIAFGSGSSASVYGTRAFANGSFATSGDAQDVEAVLRNITTTATPTELFLDGTSATQRLALANNSACTAIIKIIARRTDATGVLGSWIYHTMIYRDATAATTTMVGTSKSTIARVGLTSANDPVLSADTTNGSLKINVTGLAANTIRWVATVELAQVTN